MIWRDLHDPDHWMAKTGPWLLHLYLGPNRKQRFYRIHVGWGPYDPNMAYPEFRRVL